MKKNKKIRMFFLSGFLLSGFVTTSTIFINQPQVQKLTHFEMRSGDFTTLTNVRTLPIDRPLANILNEVNGDVNNGGLIDTIRTVFTKRENLERVYSNLKFNLDGEQAYPNAIFFDNLRIEKSGNKWLLYFDVRIDKNNPIFAFNPQLPDNQFDIKNFHIEGFNNPQLSQIIDVGLKSTPKPNYNPSEYAPHEINNVNDKSFFQNFLDIADNRFPAGTRFELDITPINHTGEITFNKVIADKHYGEESYDQVLGKKEFLIPPKLIGGFRRVVKTNINNQTFPKLNTQNAIKDYLQNNMMAPLHNFNQNTIRVEPQDERTAIVRLSAYYDNNYNWITSGQDLEQRIFYGEHSGIELPNVITSGQLKNNFTSPYEISLVFKNENEYPVEHERLLRILTTEIAAKVPELNNNQIEIVGVHDFNFEDNAYLDVDYNYQYKGIKNPATVRFENLNYTPVSFTLKSNFSISDKAADYLTNDNFNKIIQINNPLPGALYELDDSNKALDYFSGTRYLIFKPTKVVNKTSGKVEEGTLPETQIKGFKEIDRPSYLWKQGPTFGVTLNENGEKYLEQNFLFKSSSYERTKFENNTQLKPKISNFQIKNEIKDIDKMASISFDLTNFIDEAGNKILEPNKKNVETIQLVLPTTEGVFKITDDVTFTNENVYDYIYLVPAMSEYFGKPFTPQQMRESFNKKGYELRVIENNKVQLFRHSTLIGEIIKAKPLPAEQPYLLKVLIIVLIVVGVIGLIVLILFFVLNKKINQKAKALKQKKLVENQGESVPPPIPQTPNSN